MPPPIETKTPEERLAEIHIRLKRASGGLSREMDFLWAIRQLTLLNEDLWEQVKTLKDARYGRSKRK